ncbi:allophanate hydrolase subunit 1 [Cereibacter sphaeroides]|uniref:5-oxoprolinase subunit B family protein n=1 Tax=Cereibacter sphaeroides TaxID=1063 RepID=UPI001F46D3F4|nr:allophanate hydrolase subunit 1 [Cereibacter sphaeroides]MCE6951033.1 allophanate hydrolase subunit 1 [Cereibacter sphaeroides]
MTGFPRIRALAERAILVEFADRPDETAGDRVARLDAALAAAPFPGFTEAVPAYVSLLVGFDPLVTDHAAAEAAVRAHLAKSAEGRPDGPEREVPACYDAAVAPDLAEVAARTGLAPETVVRLHLAGSYRVVMYGFAPGYAYLAGVPEALHLPRKPAALRDVPAGSVLIAGPQCLVSTLTMPTGWWIIGRSPARILTGDPRRPFLFDPGDRVRFRRIAAAELPA